jgi:acetyl esterase/lipase
MVMQDDLDRRQLLAAMGSTGLMLATGARAAADPMALLDPELRAAARALPVITVDATTLPARRAIPDLPPLPPPAPQPQFRTIPGAKGMPDVRVMIIDGSAVPSGKPAYLHMHGGGFVAGRLTQNPAIQQRLAQEAGCLIVSVDYRLAPETRFPGALDDNYAALRWLHEQADALGVDRTRIAVGGDSAGGGHAAMLAIAARDRGEYPIAFQLLVYPMLDDRTASTVSVPPHIGTMGWTRESNRFGWASLLGQAPGLAAVPAGSVPARIDNLAGLPPTFIAVGGLDLFVGENIAYAQRLNAAGVPVELLLVPGAFHGFQNVVPDARISRQFKAAIASALRRGLARA